jgi:hypothetical protein
VSSHPAYKFAWTSKTSKVPGQKTPQLRTTSVYDSEVGFPVSRILKTPECPQWWSVMATSTISFEEGWAGDHEPMSSNQQAIDTVQVLTAYHHVSTQNVCNARSRKEALGPIPASIPSGAPPTSVWKLLHLPYLGNGKGRRPHLAASGVQVTNSCTPACHPRAMRSW